MVIRAEIARRGLRFVWKSGLFPLARFLRYDIESCGGIGCGCGIASTNNKQPRQEKTMKLYRIITMCAVVATLCLSTESLWAQADNGAGNGAAGNGGGNGFGGNGGNGFGGGGGRRGGGNFDPAQRLQMQLDNIRTQLEITNDTDWAAIQPLVQKVLDARTALGNAGRGGFGGRGGGRRGGGQGGPGGQTTASLEQQALQKAIDDDAPAAQIKAALDRFEASQKTKQATLTAAQEALREVLTAKQEAEATLMGLLP
jgi:hypothetical protein